MPLAASFVERRCLLCSSYPSVLSHFWDGSRHKAAPRSSGEVGWQHLQWGKPGGSCPQGCWLHRWKGLLSLSNVVFQASFIQDFVPFWKGEKWRPFLRALYVYSHCRSPCSWRRWLQADRSAPHLRSRLCHGLELVGCPARSSVTCFHNLLLICFLPSFLILYPVSHPYPLPFLHCPEVV